MAGSEVGGRGGRTGCSGSGGVEVELGWDRPFLTDPVLDYRSGTYVNITLTVDADCLVGRHDYYVDTRGTNGAGGYATSSPRLTARCS